MLAIAPPRPHKSAALHPRERARRRAVNRGHDFRDVRFDDRPANGGERNQSDLPPFQILFVVKCFVAGNEYIETIVRRDLEKSAVGQISTTYISGCERVVMTKEWAQVVRSVSVQ